MTVIRRVVLSCALLVGSALPAFAQFPLGQPLTVTWDGAANEAEAGVTQYEVRVDAGAWTASGQGVPQASYRYALPQALLTIGAHTVGVRACAGATCGPDAPVTLTITRPLPGLPRNPAVVPTPVVVSLTVPDAINRAHAYALLIFDRLLTPDELALLGTRHGNVPPTRESVLRVLDASFAQFVIREP